MFIENIANVAGRSEIPRIILDKEAILIAVHDGGFKLYETEKMVLVKKIDVLAQYIQIVRHLQEKYLVGLDDGRIRVYNNQFQWLNEFKLHSDVISDIVEFQNQLISISLDGTIVIFDKETYSITKRFQFGRPLWRIKHFQGSLYITSSENSIKINMNDNSCQYLCTARYFQIYNDEIYCCDNFSIRNLTRNIASYISADCLLASSQCLYAFRDEMVGILENIDSSSMHWKWIRVAEFKRGFEFRSAVASGDKIFLCGDMGKVFKIDSKKLKQSFY